MSCVTVPLALVSPSAIVYLIARDLIIGRMLRAAAKRESITFAEHPELIITKVFIQCLPVQISISTMMCRCGSKSEYGEKPWERADRGVTDRTLKRACRGGVNVEVAPIEGPTVTLGRRHLLIPGQWIR